MWNAMQRLQKTKQNKTQKLPNQQKTKKPSRSFSVEQWDHKTGLAPETDGTTIVTVSAAIVIYRHKNVDHLETQSELPSRETAAEPTAEQSAVVQDIPPAAADANAAGQQRWGGTVQLCWHLVHAGTWATSQGKMANFNIHTEKINEMLSFESLQSTGILFPD